MTPLIQLNDVYFKREDANQTGSTKDRAVSLQVEHLKELGFTKAVISSTGNAAISATKYCAQNNIDLTVFVSPKTSAAKLKLISNPQFTNKPISEAFKYAKANHAYNLRASKDPIALLGYSDIGKEIVIQCPEVTSIFVPVGSGATLLGISKTLPSKVKIFAVQPASNPTIAAVFDKEFVPEAASITDALTVKSLPLKNDILKAIRISGGGGAVVHDAEVKATQKELEAAGLSTSAEGALALAGYHKISRTLDCGKFPVILLTGINRN